MRPATSPTSNQNGSAALARTYCLTCHRVNGYDGDMLPIDLAGIVKGMDAPAFRRWVLAPGSVRPGTGMPALAASMPQARREEMAGMLYEYLYALPVAR